MIYWLPCTICGTPHEVVRDVRHQHHEHVHTYFDTQSESELQHTLDQTTPTEHGLVDVDQLVEEIDASTCFASAQVHNMANQAIVALLQSPPDFVGAAAIMEQLEDVCPDSRGVTQTLKDIVSDLAAAI